MTEADSHVGRWVLFSHYGFSGEVGYAAVTRGLSLTLRIRRGSQQPGSVRSPASTVTADGEKEMVSEDHSLGFPLTL